MKSALFYGMSCLFMAAAAKPFVTADDASTTDAWASFRSYPYAHWADIAARAQQWPQAAHYYAEALRRNPSDTRFARGILFAWWHMLAQIPKSAVIPALHAPKIPVATIYTSQAAPRPPKQAVRFVLPADPQTRRQQTAWRGPIVALTAPAPVVPFQEKEPPAPVLHASPPASRPSGPDGTLTVAAFTPLPPARAGRWSVTSSALIRAKAVPSGIPAVSPFGGSQSGAELRWRVNDDAARPLQIAAAGFIGTDTGYSLNPQTAQAVIGLRYKPFETVNLVVGADLLIRLGNRARNDFALRLMADAGANYDMPYDRARWLHWHAGADAALIGVTTRDLYARGDARIGMGFRLSDTLSVTPYIGADAVLQSAGSTQTLVEAGPGVWLRARLADQARVDVKLSYRLRIAGNTPAQNAVLAQVAVGF